MRSQKKQIKKTVPSKKLYYAMLILSTVGFFDALYLTIKHYTNTSLPCFITTGCDVVTNSAYALIFGVPVALLGVLYYTTILSGSLIILHAQAKVLQKYFPYWTISGFLASVYFVYLQVFVIHALCTYCIISAITSTGIFICGMILVSKNSQR